MARIARSTVDLKADMMQACASLFNEKGLKFTMTDVANRCHISKKTMYLIFDDKDAMFLAAVDYTFDKIKESEKEVLEDDSLDTISKLKRLLGVLPESYAEIDFSKMHSLREKHPAIYKQVEKRLETGWEPSIELIKKGQEEGLIRKDIHVALVKTMVEASLEQFFQRDILVQNKISYNEALKEIVEVIIEGIRER